MHTFFEHFSYSFAFIHDKYSPNWVNTNSDKSFSADPKLGPESGQIIANGNGGGNTNFQISRDDKVFTPVEGNGTSTVVIKNLEPGVYYVQCRPVLTKGKIAPWSQSMKITVN